jgi:hypothetical protein
VCLRVIEEHHGGGLGPLGAVEARGKVITCYIYNGHLEEVRIRKEGRKKERNIK